ncbi:MAG: DNA repair protein RadA [Clostridiales bacterium]|jgi:DNA repair protein RadA/Sms|nr:DNA repair protein RadA [Clostridiales bacterium]
MVSKAKVQYVCSECGFESAKWYGKCPGCGQWNCMEEELRTASVKKTLPTASEITGIRSFSRPVGINEINSSEEERYHTGLSELDRVLGGGIVKGSLILISGDPGIGKSTILLQICEYLGQSYRILYVSGEESGRQIKLRAARLGVTSNNLYIMTETDLQYILEQIRSTKPDLVMIDSIQTMNHTELSSSPGSITQVRECTNAVMQVAKALDIPTILVGHVNKDGAIAGPKVLEHIVDAVLYFEGDRHMSYRILRAVKNRYGSTNEIGVFDMGEQGLREVDNPSMALLSGRPKQVSGTCVTCVMEGSRPILAEIQGLATTTGFGNPRRMATGFDYNRMSLLLAVLEKRAGYYFSNLDAYINVVGGLRLDEPATDLAVAMALVSSLKDVPISDNAILFGEIGLAGEIRSVNHMEARITEAARLGFQKCIVPYHNFKQISQHFDDMQIIGVKQIREAFEAAID